MSVIKGILNSSFTFLKLSRPSSNPGPLNESTEDLFALSNEALKT